MCQRRHAADTPAERLLHRLWRSDPGHVSVDVVQRANVVHTHLGVPADDGDVVPNDHNDAISDARYLAPDGDSGIGCDFRILVELDDVKVEVVLFANARRTLRRKRASTVSTSSQNTIKYRF